MEGESIARLEEEVGEAAERGDLGRKPARTQSQSQKEQDEIHRSMSVDELGKMNSEKFEGL